MPSSRHRSRRSEWLARLSTGDPGKGFLWMPAGMTQNLACEIGIRNTQWRHARIFCGYHRVDKHRYRLADRELTINTRPDTQHLDPTHYDQIVLLSPWHTVSPVNQTLSLVMSNAHTDSSANGFRRRTQQGDLIGVADSGGYQLKRGKNRGHVDPREVVRWMNAGCDVGLVLDIAPEPEHDDGNNEVYRALALAQRETCRVMLGEKIDSLHLLNIAQGSTFDQARHWIDTVHADGCVGWATSLSDRNSLRTGLLLIKEYGVSWIHFLGKSRDQDLPLMAWLGRYVRVTCDSSSYLVGTQYRAYLWADPFGRFTRLPVFAKSSRRVGRRDGIALPCNCAVCDALRYGDLFRVDEPVFGRLMSLHNLIVLSRYVLSLSALASQKKMTAAKYRERVVAPYGERTMALFDYMEIAMANGLAAAERDALGWKGKKRYAKLFPRPTTKPCREMLLSEWTADDRMPCRHSNLYLLPRYLDLRDPRVREKLSPRVSEWLVTNGDMPPADCLATPDSGTTVGGGESGDHSRGAKGTMVR